MEKNDLVAELKKAIIPIKEYLANQREYESLENKTKGGGEFSSFSDGYRSGGLLVRIEQGKIKAESAMPKVELLIELIEKL